MSTNVNTIRSLADREYKWGFVTEMYESGELQQSLGVEEAAKPVEEPAPQEAPPLSIDNRL